MKYYQLIYLISPELSEEEIKNLQEKIRSLVIQAQGILNKEGNPTKERLAYPIKKNEVAFLVSLNFHLNPEALKVLEKQLKLENKILRYQIVAEEVTGVPTKIKSVSEIKLKVKKPKKVELKEIEEKLEEILGE